MTADDVSSRCIEFIKGKLQERRRSKLLELNLRGNEGQLKYACMTKASNCLFYFVALPPPSSRSTIFRHTKAKDQEHSRTTLFLHR